MVDDGIVLKEDLDALKKIRYRAKKEFSKGNRDHKYFGSWD